jgi:hypothetical protein
LKKVSRSLLRYATISGTSFASLALQWMARWLHRQLDATLCDASLSYEENALPSSASLLISDLQLLRSHSVAWTTLGRPALHRTILWWMSLIRKNSSMLFLEMWNRCIATTVLEAKYPLKWDKSSPIYMLTELWLWSSVQKSKSIAEGRWTRPPNMLSLRSFWTLIYTLPWWKRRYSGRCSYFLQEFYHNFVL